MLISKKHTRTQSEFAEPVDGLWRRTKILSQELPNLVKTEEKTDKQETPSEKNPPITAKSTLVNSKGPQGTSGDKPVIGTDNVAKKNGPLSTDVAFGAKINGGKDQQQQLNVAEERLDAGLGAKNGDVGSKSDRRSDKAQGKEAPPGGLKSNSVGDSMDHDNGRKQNSREIEQVAGREGQDARVHGGKVVGRMAREGVEDRSGKRAESDAVKGDGDGDDVAPKRRRDADSKESDDWDA
jgi:hypothetical protein